MTPAVAKPPAAAIGDDFVDAASRALASGKLDLVADAELERVLTVAVRLYAAKAESDSPPPTPVTASELTPTDVVTVVSDIIHAAGLNLWDVSMWFRRRD
jgi:hypothetical protein